jgi:hypothetical protein
MSEVQFLSGCEQRRTSAARVARKPGTGSGATLHRALVAGYLCCAALLTDAAVAQTLPPASYSLTAYAPLGFSSSRTTAGAVTASYCNPSNLAECETGQLNASGGPTLSGLGISTGTGPNRSSNLLSYTFGAGGTVEYFFEVVDSRSAIPTPVTLTFSAVLGADYSGTGSAGAIVTIGTGSSVQAPLLSEQVEAGPGPATYPGKLVLNNVTYTAMTNTVEAVTMEGSASGGSIAGQACDTPNVCAGTAGFFIDPVIGIFSNQPNAADYRLIFSAGIKNAATPTSGVPEPGTLALMLSGLAAMSRLRRQLRTGQ